MIGGRFGEWFEAPSYEEGVGVDGKIRGPALGWGLGVSPIVKRSQRNEPLFKGRRKQGCKKTMARPEGAQALRAIQEVLDEGRGKAWLGWMLLLVLFFAPKKRTDPFGSFRKEHRATP